MIQDGIIIFALAFFIGSGIDRLLNYQQADDSMTNFQLISWIVLQLIVNIIVIYYIRKIAETIPFFLSLSSNYVSNKKGEVDFSSGFVSSIIFVGVQKNFQAKLALLKSRFALNS